MKNSYYDNEKGFMWEVSYDDKTLIITNIPYVYSKFESPQAIADIKAIETATQKLYIHNLITVETADNLMVKFLKTLVA